LRKLKNEDVTLEGPPEGPNFEMIRFLADVNIEKAVVDFIRVKGFDVLWATDYDRRMSDKALLNLANREKRILLTNDKDFGELMFLQKKAATGIVLFRIKGQSSRDKTRQIETLLNDHESKLAGCFVVISKNRFRFIPMEGLR
jgi:predicted nuclease of predicted toxin-antitoxin system